MSAIRLKHGADGMTTEVTEVRLDRVGNEPSTVYEVTIGAERHHAEIEYAASSDGLAHGWIRVRGRVHSFRVARRGNVVETWVGGRRHVLEIVDRTAQRATHAAAAGTSGDLTAPMPGRILAINVQPGDAFAAHAPLIIMESMKMEMTISSPFAGLVGEILCAEGELVEMGELLARLRPAEDGDGARGVES